MFRYSYNINPLAMELTGLRQGGQKIQECRDLYTSALDALIDIATLQVFTHKRK
mgnify:CR=1 FL=1